MCMSVVDLSVAELVDVLRSEGSDLPEVEVKRGSGGYPQDLPRTLSAFGNMPAGGRILIGLDERRDFAATGVSDPADFQRRIASQAREAVMPALTVTFETVTFEGAQLVLARVHELPASAKPCRVTSNGKAYLRSYDGDFSLSEQEEQAFVANRGAPTFDRLTVAGTAIGDLDPALVAAYVTNCRNRSPRLSTMDDHGVLFHTRVIDREGVVTLAGLYALGSYPQRIYPTLSVTAKVAPLPSDPPGTRGSDVRYLDGPLPEMLDQAIQWVRRNTATRVRFGADGHARDEPEYPAEAVRELVANALVHRDLGPHALSQRVTITLEQNRLVVANPGGLWGLTVDQLGRVPGGSARNQSLYDICKDTRTAGDRRVIEGLGSGIEAIRRALAQAGMTAPHFIDAGIRFTALVPNHALLDPQDLEWVSSLPGTAGLGDVQRHVLVAMRHGTEWTNRSLRDQFPMDSTEARSLLTDLVERGLAEPAGERRARSYHLDPQVEIPLTARTSPLWVRTEGPQITIATRGATGLADATMPEGAGALRPHAADTEAAVTRHGDAITDILKSGPHTTAELSALAGLSQRQATYALGKLRTAGVIVRDGGRGDRSTTYRLSSPPAAE